MILSWRVATASILSTLATGAEGAASSATMTRRSLEEHSFRFRLDWNTGSGWVSPFEWCVECEYGGSSGPSCREGDMLILDRCGSSERQRFIFDRNRIMPLASPELCLTRDDNAIFLSECDDDNKRQRFYGLDSNDKFELYQGSGGSKDDGE